MKKYIFCILPFMNMLNLSAQFSGGNGKGDNALALSNQTLSGETITIYLGGNGRGDNQALVTEVFFSDDVQYFGGSGRGDVLVSASALYLSDDMRYVGGNGRGEATAGFTGKVLSQRVLWRGGQVTGNETSSTRGSNWYPSGLPVDTSELALEDNSNTYDLVLQGNLRVKSIDFNGANKKIVVGSNTLVITDKVTGANANNYIRTPSANACVRFFVPDNEFRLMPVGNSAYNPVTITNKTGVLDSFCVFVGDEVNSRGLIGRTLWNVPRVKRTWYIAKGSGTSNLGNGVDFEFRYNSGEDSGITTMDLFHWNGNNWAIQTGGSGGPGTYSFIGYKGTFSPFALGTGVSPLPVSWLDMRCARKGTQSVEVRWKTASEEGSQSFYIQRSTGGVFRDIDSIPAAGYSYEPKSYSYTDRTAPSGTLFYRIRQLDQDGKQSFSDVCATAQATLSELRVMNNPADKEFKVWTGMALEGAAYRLINAAGQEVGSGRLLSGMTAIPTEMLPSGCYTFQIMNAENPFFSKVVVLHP